MKNRIENFQEDWTGGAYAPGGQYEQSADPKADVMALFGGDMNKYNAWYNNLRPEDRPKNWDDALIGARGSMGAGAFKGGQVRTGQQTGVQPLQNPQAQPIVPQGPQAIGMQKQGFGAKMGGMLGQMMQRADYAGAGVRQKLGQVFGGGQQQQQAPYIPSGPAPQPAAYEDGQMAPSAFPNQAPAQVPPQAPQDNSALLRQLASWMQSGGAPNIGG
jgi:hypothetical protein